MLPDLFSQFDPSMGLVFQFSGFIFWAILYWFIIFFRPFLFLGRTKEVELMGAQLKGVFRSGKNSVLIQMPGLFVLFSSVFLMVFFLNIFGLFYATFSLTSHFLFSVGLALPLWLGTLFSSFSQKPLVKIGHLVGTKIPLLLGPPVGMCEIVSNLIRPLALSLRLAANMLAGHIITSLIGNCAACAISSSLIATIPAFIVVVGFFLFETFVCFIQAYVFTLLLQIYVAEYPH